jgi:hypothetical protein
MPLDPVTAEVDTWEPLYEDWPLYEQLKAGGL